jgi:hypothetical protein
MCPFTILSLMCCIRQIHFGLIIKTPSSEAALVLGGGQFCTVLHRCASVLAATTGSMTTHLLCTNDPMCASATQKTEWGGPGRTRRLPGDCLSWMMETRNTGSWKDNCNQSVCLLSGKLPALPGDDTWFAVMFSDATLSSGLNLEARPGFQGALQAP